jgi:ankyrin repeat protein
MDTPHDGLQPRRSRRHRLPPPKQRRIRQRDQFVLLSSYFTLIEPSTDSPSEAKNGQTALHFAASKSNLDVARQLIAHKASTRTRDRRAQVPLHRAAAVGAVPMIKLLLQNRSPLNGQDVDGLTALHHGVFLPVVNCF